MPKKTENKNGVWLGAFGVLLFFLLNGQILRKTVVVTTVNPEPEPLPKYVSALWFDIKEFFKNIDPPQDRTIINNYNRLITDLDLTRANLLAPVQIVKGFVPGDADHGDASTVIITSEKPDKLFAYMVQQIEANHITKGTIYKRRSDVYYKQTGVYRNEGNV